MLDAQYDDTVHFDELVPLGGIVYSWLRVKDAPHVRVQVSRKFVEDVWNVDWGDKNSVEREFRLRRGGYMDAAMKSTGGGPDYRVYEIG
jgi:hypothetical protein